MSGERHQKCMFQSDKPWLDLKDQHGNIRKLEELCKDITPPPHSVDEITVDRIRGSMIGMALGDALGASVEFRPQSFLRDNKVKDMQGGGTWGLQKGQFTDDTSMGLCLASSLIARRDFVPYDQLVRYKWWHQHGYMSSTGDCFDIGAGTKHALNRFVTRQKDFSHEHNIPLDDLDYLSDTELLNKFNVMCSDPDAAGNGALMRLAPIPLFFRKNPERSVYYSGYSAALTHRDPKSTDACRYYGALIVAAVNGESKDDLLDKDFYKNHQNWFGDQPLDSEVMKVAAGSFKEKDGYKGGIRGAGFVIKALEAALWAFWSTKDFEKGALSAVNLGDDTDTTAAIYGQLAGAYYGFNQLPEKWVNHLHAKSYILSLGDWIAYEGYRWPQAISDNEQNNEPRTDQASSKQSDKKSDKDGKDTKTSTEPKSYQNPHQPSSKKQQKTTAEESTKKKPIPDEARTSTEPKSYQNPHQPSSEKQQKNTAEEPTKKKPIPDQARTSTEPKSDQHLHQTSSEKPQKHTVEESTTKKPTTDGAKPSSEGKSQHSGTRLYIHKTMKSAEDVCAWLEKLNPKFEKYKTNFHNIRIDPHWLLNLFEQKHFDQLGITDKNDQKQILKGIEELRKECPEQYSAM